jgi:hypothetical protein
MKKRKLTFFKKSKIFFSPIRENKQIYIRGIFIYFVWAFDRITHIIFLERIIHCLEK